jgi:anthranilate phosphoribosyltransferase
VRFRYASIALARLVGREYVEKSPLAAALAALMRRGPDPEELELLARMLRRVVTSPLEEGQQALLVDVIKAYFPVPESEKERFERLLSRKEYKVVQDV